MTVNILFINSIQMFGGGEVWLLSTMKGLSKRHHQVSLICRPGTTLEEKAKAEGFSVVSLKMRGDFDPFVIFKTFRVMKAKKIDVLCTNMDKELRFGGIAAKLAGVKAIIPRRGIDYPLKNKARYRFSYNWLASKIIANSQATKKTLLREAPWLDSDKVKVIYNGVDVSRFNGLPQKNLRKELQIGRDNPVIGFVGQLDARKGVVYLLEAFKQVILVFPQAKLIMAGEGAQRPYIENWTVTNDLSQKVKLLGFREDIDDVMKAIDILVLPSLWEGFGIVLVEAMAAGKPVVATRASNIPEVVSDGQTGFLVPPQNPAELSHAIITLLENNKLAETMGQNGRKDVERRFTLQRMLDQIENLFYEALEKPN